MIDSDVYKRLLDDSSEALAVAPPDSGAIIGDPDVASQLIQDLAAHGLSDRVYGFFGTESSLPQLGCSVVGIPLARLNQLRPTVLVVAADADKEDHLLSVCQYIIGTPKVVIAGYGHFDYRDPIYYSILAKLEEPSLANGYPNSRIHLYQCLVNASRLGLSGVVAEFGMFRGGTTMFLSRVIEELGEDWPVVGFDTFAGFPVKRSFLDMYDHEDLALVRLKEVQRYLQARRVEIVPGDLRETVKVLVDRPVVLAFIDTDNFSSGTTALEATVDRIVPGGAIVFDHVAGVDRFVYTLGERIAAKSLYADPRFFNLHGTGVFIRQAPTTGPTS